MFSPDHLQAFSHIIDKWTLIFVGENIGSDVLSTSDQDFLRSLGVNTSIFPEEGKMEEAFKFGMLSQFAKRSELKKMKYHDFKKYMNNKLFIPLTLEEKAMVKHLKTRAYHDITGLGNTISEDFKSIAIEASAKQRQDYEKIIRREATHTILDREGVKEMVSRLGHKTGNWSRDFGRISDFLTHGAFDQGIVAAIKKESGEDAEVYKDVYDKACKHCIRLYLTDGIGSKPIIFKLKDIIANGTNIGKKVDEWKPVVGSTHPWCRCTLCQKRKDRGWDPEMKAFSRILAVKRDILAERGAKIKVTIN